MQGLAIFVLFVLLSKQVGEIFQCIQATYIAQGKGNMLVGNGGIRLTKNHIITSMGIYMDLSAIWE